MQIIISKKNEHEQSSQGQAFYPRGMRFAHRWDNTREVENRIFL